MNQADENDLLGQVREALGADPKEGVVAAARRIKVAADDATDRGYSDIMRRELDAGSEESCVAAAMRVMREHKAARVERNDWQRAAKAAEEALADEAGKRVQAEQSSRLAELEASRLSRVLTDIALMASKA